MRLVVGTNFDDNLIEKIKEYPVKYIFGSHTRTITGHGRASFVLPQIDDERFKQHLDVAHSEKIKFLYTMNTASLNGKEYDEKFVKKVQEEVDYLVRTGVDGFIVAMPFLIKLIKKEYPDMEVSVSSFSRIYNIREVEEYVNLGANTIIMHEDDNRNFDLLQSVAKYGKSHNVDVEVLTNNSCLWGCPYRRSHDIVSSELSMIDGPKGVWFEYPILFCATDVRNDIANIIRMRWIRPEDLHHYEEIGIDRFKIAGRNKKTDWIVKVVKAYSERKYDGNLLDIVSYPQGRAVPKVLELLGEKDNEYEILTKVVVNNSEFPPNWLGYFKYNKCEIRSCEDCKYCDMIAEKVIKVNGKSLNELKLKKIDTPIELIPRFGNGKDKE
ncbi:U32 family peptidase [Acidianus sulfidivorans JP7]|uniref:Peptidase U32 n=1 Tax=Acidianus sulfidivorans JP7 TaxID=619593 RepID=A0A2U9IQP9_9CREN|nr:peptidase U32 family protein [Acidianus sulfidivorans]AWR98352.1 U32 family peptidase [Acidianus sulfidivorans JP7]